MTAPTVSCALDLDDTWAYGAGVLHDGWLRVVQRARSVHGGWLDEQCEGWDSAGQLVAQARRLARWAQP